VAGSVPMRRVICQLQLRASPALNSHSCGAYEYKGQR
jgi:hypothetical protein